MGGVGVGGNRQALVLPGRGQALGRNFIRQDRFDLALAAGVARGVFRAGLSARDVYLMIASLNYFYLSNRHTLSAFFGARLESPEALAHWEAFIVDAVRRTLAPPDRLPAG